MLSRSLLILLALGVGPSYRLVAQEQPPPPASRSEVQTSGSWTLTVPADLATISIEFTARARTPRAAGRAAAQRANAIRQALLSLGIPQDSMPTGGRWGWWGARSQMLVDPSGRDTTFTTSDVLTVRIRDLALIGRAIDTALVQGAQTISNIQFAATDTRAARLEALREATRQARASAEAIAEASGGHLGRVIELTTERRGYEGYSGFRLEEIVTSASSGATTVVTPQLHLSVTVYGRWILEPTKP